MRVFFYYLAGKKTRDNAIEHCISTGAVSEIVRDYRKLLKDKEIEAMRDLVLFCTQQGTDLADFAQAIRLHSMLLKNGSETAVEQAETWTAGLLAIAKEHPEKVFQVLIEILQRSEEDGISPILTLDRIKQIKQEQKKEEDRLATLKGQADQANLMCTNALAKAGLTKEYIELFETLAKKLRNWGLDVAEKIVVFVESMEKLGKDPKRAVDELTSFEEARKERRKILSENMKLAEKQKTMRARDEIYRLLSDLPLTPEFWLQLGIKFQAIALTRDEDVAMAAPRALLDFVNFYDNLLGLRAAILQGEIIFKQEQGENKSLKEDNDELRKDNERLRKEKSGLKADVEQLNSNKNLLLDVVTDFEGKIQRLRDEKRNLELEGQDNKEQGDLVRQTPNFEFVNVAVKESGLTHFNSGSTTPTSGCVTTSGFVPQFNSGSRTRSSGCVTTSGFVPNAPPS